jgi:hypothetical protein
MKWGVLAVSWAVGVTFASGQVPPLKQPVPELLPPPSQQPLPAVLPNPLNPAPKPNGPTSPSPRELPPGLTPKEEQPELLTFNPDTVQVTKLESRWIVRSGPETMIRDWGANQMAAVEMARAIQELRVNQIGIVPGARPTFEYWLADGKAIAPLNSRRVVLPVSPNNLRAEAVGGVWVITDGARTFYDFGNDEAAAKKSLDLFQKHGFNQLGVIGSPRPVAFFPLRDPWQKDRNKKATPGSPSLGVINEVSQTNLLLSGNRLAGPKNPVDIKLFSVKQKGEWALLYNEELVARFGNDRGQAEAALKTLQYARPTSVAILGKIRFPIFLQDDAPISGAPLNAKLVRFVPERLRILKWNEKWWIFEEGRQVMEVGSKEDAQMLLEVIQSMRLEMLCTFGRPEQGGLRLLTRGR